MVNESKNKLKEQKIDILMKLKNIVYPAYYYKIEIKCRGSPKFTIKRPRTKFIKNKKFTRGAFARIKKY